MTLQTGKDAMITHPLSSVCGSYVITMDGAPMFVTADSEILFENLQGVSFADAAKVRVLLVSNEDWSQDDITDFVWEAMVEHYAGTFAHDTLEEWDDHVGYDIAFCRWGFDEFNPGAERAKRRREADERAARIAALRTSEPAYAVAAE